MLLCILNKTCIIYYFYKYNYMNTCDINIKPFSKIIQVFIVSISTRTHAHAHTHTHTRT